MQEGHREAPTDVNRGAPAKVVRQRSIELQTAAAPLQWGEAVRGVSRHAGPAPQRWADNSMGEQARVLADNRMNCYSRDIKCSYCFFFERNYTSC